MGVFERYETKYLMDWLEEIVGHILKSSHILL